MPSDFTAPQLKPSDSILAQLYPTPLLTACLEQRRGRAAQQALNHPLGFLEWFMSTAGAAKGKGCAAGRVNVSTESRQVPSEPGCFLHFLQNLWGYSLYHIKEWKIPVSSRAVARR